MKYTPLGQGANSREVIPTIKFIILLSYSPLWNPRIRHWAIFTTAPPNNPKIPKQTFGLLAITLAWMATMIVASVYQVIKYGKTEDLQVIIVWSALFVFVAWLVFIVTPLAIIRPTRKIFRITIFPFITGCYAAAVYALLIGILFPIEVIQIYMGWAIMIGVLFGLVYSLLSSSEKLIRQRPICSCS